MLKDIISKIISEKDKVEAWIDSHKEKLGSHILYSSVDLRNSGHKIVPVDTNMFPAGWNNLCPSCQKRAKDAFVEYFQNNYPETRCLVILPESHTRNTYYLENVLQLQEILRGAGFNTAVGTINPAITEMTTLQTAEGNDLNLYPIVRDGDNLFIESKKICQLVVNNDFSAGVPEILQGVKQNLLPNPGLGWHSRKKSDHFDIYSRLVSEFADLICVPKEHFDARFQVAEKVNLDDEDSRELVAQKVEAMIDDLNKIYKEYKIDYSPTVFIKNNAGTYGMAVVSVESGEDVRNLNQKARKKMRVGKEGSSTSNLILQEGVPTTDRIKDFAAEPVIYMVNNKPIGGFFRLNTQKGDTENLNSRGMEFSKGEFLNNPDYTNPIMEEVQGEDVIYAYKTIANIAGLAAGYESRNNFDSKK